MGWYREPPRALTREPRELAQTQWRHVERGGPDGGHITGMDALNLPTGPAGDWHGARWHVTVGSAASTRTAETERLCKIGNELWGRKEIIDAREALQRIGHPEGNGEQPVWAATHARAVAEMVMAALHATGWIPDPDPRSARRWLDTTQRQVCTEMLHEASESLGDEEKKTKLDRWTEAVMRREGLSRAHA